MWLCELDSTSSGHGQCYFGVILMNLGVPLEQGFHSTAGYLQTAQIKQGLFH